MDSGSDPLAAHLQDSDFSLSEFLVLFPDSILAGELRLPVSDRTAIITHDSSHWRPASSYWKVSSSSFCEPFQTPESILVRTFDHPLLEPPLLFCHKPTICSDQRLRILQILDEFIISRFSLRLGACRRRFEIAGWLP